VPGYLKLAILKMTKVFYEMVDQNMENFKSFKAGDVSRVLKDDQVPKFVQGVIAMMRRQSYNGSAGQKDKYHLSNRGDIFGRSGRPDRSGSGII